MKTLVLGPRNRAVSRNRNYKAELDACWVNVSAGRGGATAGDGDLRLSVWSGITYQKGTNTRGSKGNQGEGLSEGFRVGRRTKSQQRSMTGCRKMSSEDSRRQTREKHRS